MASDFDVFHRAVLADPALQARLDATYDPDAFAAEAGCAARALGLALPAGALRPGARRRSDPCPDWAPDGWLPVALSEGTGGWRVEWARFGPARLVRSFFADSIRERVARPFNRVFRHATALDAFIDGAPHPETTALAGFIFHMSRCGSTLVARMLGTLDATVSLSEPGPLDAAIRFAIKHPEIPRTRHVALLRAMVAALARARDGERRCVIKLDSWHILAMPLLKEAFPDVPWVYLFRDPVEVLVSQMRLRGYQTVPALLPAGVYGGDIEGLSHLPARQCATIFERHHRAAIDALGAGGGGIAIDYAALPGAVETLIAPHFGIALSPIERDRIAACALLDAKASDQQFSADGARKRGEASAEVRAGAAQLAPLHAALRDLACRSSRFPIVPAHR